jgi:hypothetical protein
MPARLGECAVLLARATKLLQATQCDYPDSRFSLSAYGSEISIEVTQKAMSAPASLAQSKQENTTTDPAWPKSTTAS